MNLYWISKITDLIKNEDYVKVSRKFNNKFKNLSTLQTKTLILSNIAILLELILKTNNWKKWPFLKEKLVFQRNMRRSRFFKELILFWIKTLVSQDYLINRSFHGCISEKFSKKNQKKIIKVMSEGKFQLP